MSSLFSMKLRPQRARSPSSSSQLGHIGYITGEVDGAWQQSSKSSSTFSRMRKKRPPPISISVENGNVILTSATPTSRVMYSDPPWAPSTPSTPHTANAVCTCPWCRESGFMPAGQASTVSLPWTSNPQNTTANGVSHYCFFPTELPPCDSNTSPVELEAQPPSSPTTQTRGNGADQGSVSPPDLAPSTPQSREVAVDARRARSELRRRSDPRYNDRHTLPAESEGSPAVQPESPPRSPRSYTATSLPANGGSQSRVIHRERAESAALPLVDAMKDDVVCHSVAKC